MNAWSFGERWMYPPPLDWAAFHLPKGSSSVKFNWFQNKELKIVSDTKPAIEFHYQFWWVYNNFSHWGKKKKKEFSGYTYTGD